MQNPKEVKEIRAFRLGKNVLQMLQVAARRHGVSENALVEGILARNLETDSLAQAFDYVVISKDTFMPILHMAHADGLERIGAERGKKAFALAKELFESNNLELDFARYLSDVLGEQAQWFRVEGNLIRPERVTLQHGLGVKWSEFLRSYLSSAYEVVSRDKLELAITGDYVGIRFPKAAFQ